MNSEFSNSEEDENKSDRKSWYDQYISTLIDKNGESRLLIVFKVVGAGLIVLGCVGMINYLVESDLFDSKECGLWA